MFLITSCYIVQFFEFVVFQMLFIVYNRYERVICLKTHATNKIYYLGILKIAKILM